MNEIAIRAQGLTKTFGEGDVQVRAVRGVDLEVRRGEVLLIMGPSGSGKTTLLSMLGGMLRPSEGRLEIDGVDLASLPESKLPTFRARRFGFVFQDFNLLSALSAEENVEFALNLGGESGKKAREHARTLLRGFGLGERLRFKPHKLSGGEKQRIAIARALANEPAVILADEPSANLDSKIGHEIARLLRRAASEQGRAVVIVSHDQRLKDIADRILWLEDGEFRAISQMATDPVCGMAVERGGTPHFSLDGQTYFFCSTACRDEFAASPPARFRVAAGGAR
ncbi:MAG: ATP-binding cassette domain-containing protein [Actinomycetota bacterium]